MYQFVNLMQLVSVSLYFKTLVKFHNLKEDDELDISNPFNIRKSHVLFFINVIQHAKPYLYRLIMPLSLEEIFLLTDFFQVEDIFIELNELFYADLKYGPHYLKILIEYRGITDPMTTGFIENISKHFRTSPFNIIATLGHNLNSVHKLKNHLRSSKRLQEFHESMQKQTCCFICKDIVTYRSYHPCLVKDAFLATCCGNPIHSHCIDEFKVFQRCPLCTTDLCDGRPNIQNQISFQALRRNAFRDHYKIPFSHHLPLPM